MKTGTGHRAILALAAAVLIAACANAEAPKANDTPAPSERVEPAPVAAPAAPPVAPVVAADKLGLRGGFVQGGLLVGKTTPGARIVISAVGASEQIAVADANGLYVLGLDHGAGPEATVSATFPDGTSFSRVVAVAKQDYKTTVVNGLPPKTVEPPADELERIKAESSRKAKGFASMAPGEGFSEKFIWPVNGRISSPWGAFRMLNGVAQKPHYGVDIAAPLGTPVRAPASGVVSFAEDNLFFEGALILIDHGQGLVSAYLHLSRIDVKVGDVVKPGQIIGAVGAKGRATGPHLCWRMKWRDRQLDPSLLPDGPPSPATLDNK